ncbi:hypothetical protein EHW67_08080 [Arenibacter aquaticus]|uniref:Calcium/calmodulin-dependent protein kinase II association-domain domain-containing protein n=1 Tax=Arenibacter aquaticus TaxID=2489054 RepID=A0A430K4P8_9FLAO|nr:hypothetical protein [Arenibacter aquaticus]RTE53884.1 hypothetical protein EHW67_08080 [Arenibacter aquaticus]
MKSKNMLKVVVLAMLFTSSAIAQNRISELNAYWNVVKEKVEAGDVAGYGSTFHEDGVLVSESSGSCYALKKALIRWKEGLEKTAKGLTKVKLNFRFSERLGDDDSAFEKGIFRYELLDENGQNSVRFIQFDALLVKKEGKWQIMLEHQKLPATKEEWLALKPL